MSVQRIDLFAGFLDFWWFLFACIKHFLSFADKHFRVFTIFYHLNWKDFCILMGIWSSFTHFFSSLFWNLSKEVIFKAALLYNSFIFDGYFVVILLCGWTHVIISEVLFTLYSSRMLQFFFKHWPVSIVKGFAFGGNFLAFNMGYSSLQTRLMFLML
jgi:hypothetical protein